MSDSTIEPGYRRQALYYPYFTIRNERWLKVAALYWPKIVRLIPDEYEADDSPVIQALSGNCLIRQAPGRSAQAVEPQFLELLTKYGQALRTRFGSVDLLARGGNARCGKNS